MQETEPRTFEEFWPFYVRAHADKTNRTLHFVGTTLAVTSAVAGLVARKPALLLAAPGLALAAGPALAADGRTPCSWSPKVAEGGKKSTSITIKNTGNAKETVQLKPTAFVADADAAALVEYVARILREARGIVIASPALEATEPSALGADWSPVIASRAAMTAAALA